ncbi:MAG TPA: hypothetical protein ENI33_01150 [Thermoplasmatales archaeon]|nr:hypothetical protein [Thermoplasmatales archaeon]
MNKKLLLLFGIAVFFICIIGANYGKIIPEKRQVQLFLDGYMGFEEPWNISYDPDGDYPSPARYWDVDGLCIYDHHYWSQLNYGYQHAGEYCAGVLPSNGSNGDLLQNEWIKTPWLNLSGYENVFLKFYGIWNWLNAPSDNDLYNVLISDNDIYWYPLLNILTLQEGTGGPAGYGWCWNEYQVVVDVCENITDLGLNPYHIKIAWQAYGGLNDTLHSMVTLDNIEIFEGNVHNINTNEWFPNITQAINDPETLDGHILEVYPGLYVENVIVWKKVTIRSKYGNPFNTTIIPLNITKPVIEIKVNNVTLSGFEIRGGNATFPPYGIKVDNASNCIINKNVIHLVQEGILLNSSNNRITNCSIFNNSLRGISLQSSFNNEITNCTVFNSNGYGILVFYSNNNTIINCIIGNNSIGGISSWFSSNNQIMNCTIYENSLYGIYLENSPNNIIKNNTFINDGLFLAGNLNAFIQNIDTTNIVNGKPLCYFLNKSNVVITGDVGELIMANCTEFLIQNINISNTDVAMEIAFSSYNQIKNWYCPNLR